MASPHRARKRFGQNFLRDDGVINRIIRAIHPLADEHLIEIGPGQGALTPAAMPFTWPTSIQQWVLKLIKRGQLLW